MPDATNKVEQKTGHQHLSDHAAPPRRFDCGNTSFKGCDPKSDRADSGYTQKGDHTGKLERASTVSWGLAVQPVEYHLRVG